MQEKVGESFLWYRLNIQYAYRNLCWMHW